MKLTVKMSVWIALWCISLMASAALHLELTRGLNQAIPIVVLPFSGQGSALSAKDNLAGIVTADLRHSGKFRVRSVPASSRTHNLESIDFAKWQRARVNYLVWGQVERLEGRKYRVTISLVDVYAMDQQPATGVLSRALVLSKSFEVSHQAFRQLAHQISDLIYQKLTGKRGIFSTHMAYVQILRSRWRGQRYCLMLADSDGYRPRRLFCSKMPIMSPAWSPDGKQIAYVSFENQRAELYIQGVASGKRRKVSDYEGINGAPAWSPDGRFMALVLSTSGFPKVYTLALETGALQQVTYGESLDTEPSWSPTGDALLFSSNRSGGLQVYRVPMEGGRRSGKPERITYTGRYNARAAYTPDGQSIVMLHRNAPGQYNVARLEVATDQLSVLTHSGDCQSPSIAGNGDVILYTARRNGRQSLGMVSSDGRVNMALPASEGDMREPAWSPLAR